MRGQGRPGYDQGGAPGWSPGAPPPQLLVGHRRRGGTAFTVFLAVAMLLGAAVMALVLLASGAPGALVVGVVLAALPVGPVVASYMWLDRYEPEPVSLLVFGLGWGALVATAGALLLQALDQLAFGGSQAWSAVVVAPVTEEAAKGLFIVLLLVSRRLEIDGVLDGLVYAGMVGVGFAFTENILYLASAYMGDGGTGPGGIEAATGLFVVRGVFSPFAHPLFTSATGIGVGVAVVTRSRTLRFLAPLGGYLVAVLAHALWNASALIGGGRLFLLTYLFAMVPAFLLAVGLAVWARRREGRLLTGSLVDLSRRGLVADADVPWLASLAGRRAARRFARDHGGAAAARTVAEFQQQATELAFLHARYLRGTAPRDVVARGSAMVERLSALRPYVVFPTSPGRTFATPGGPAGGVSVNHWEGGR